MKYFWIQLILGLLSVVFLYYFQTLDYFRPRDAENFPNWYNIATVLALIGLFTESLISLIIYLLQKLMLFGRNEFPPAHNALKWGVSAGLIVVALLLLNIFHFLTLTWGLAIVAVVILGILILK
ncbi:hypothetical protein GF357_00345 [Candidatus Dojkabacteria bacterium]|nr:hypothetical protein [Candidatus Dojkabacteria bacterium]